MTFHVVAPHFLPIEVEPLNEKNKGVTFGPSSPTQISHPTPKGPKVMPEV